MRTRSTIRWTVACHGSAKLLLSFRILLQPTSRSPRLVRAQAFPDCAGGMVLRGESSSPMGTALGALHHLLRRRAAAPVPPVYRVTAARPLPGREVQHHAV